MTQDELNKTINVPIEEFVRELAREAAREVIREYAMELKDLHKRVANIEQRYFFLFGLALGGGLIGGSVGSMLATVMRLL